MQLSDYTAFRAPFRKTLPQTSVIFLSFCHRTIEILFHFTITLFYTLVFMKSRLFACYFRSSEILFQLFS